MRLTFTAAVCAVIGLGLGACGDDDECSDSSKCVAADTQDTSETTPDTVAETTAETTPDTVAETTPDTVAETTPDTVAETTAETVEEVTPAETVEETSPEVVVAKVTWDDVYDIFASSCTPCHNSATAGGGPSGGHSIASTDKAVAYAASQRNANIGKCSGKTIGECALIRIKDGSMPASGDCSRTPKGPKCPDAAEQALIQQWFDDGMLETN